jgi:hypothetical protein
VFVYETDRTDLDLNQIVAELPSGGGTINFNRRTGMDASSDETLDDFDYGWLRIVPREFNQDDEVIAYELHFAEPPTLLEITDVYGKGMRRVW